MKRFKVFGVMLMSLLAVGVMTASAASAESTPLPDIHTALPSETYPFTLLGELTAGTTNGIQLRNAATFLLAETAAIKLGVWELTSLGQAIIDFTGVQEDTAEAPKCNTTGDAVGVVLVPNAEWHMVYTSLSPLSTLETAGLILFTKFLVTCGPTELVITPPAMSRLVEVPGNSSNEGDSTEIETATICALPITNGVQELSSYYNDNLVLVTGQLLLVSISGGANKNGCEEIEGAGGTHTLLLTVDAGAGSSMFSVLL